MSKPIDQEREAFEAWANKEWPGAEAKQLERDEYGRYKSPIYRDYWIGWKARAQQPAGVTVPEGWRIKRDGDRIVVQDMKTGSGYAAERKGDSGIAESVLYLLADTLLAAAPHPVSGEQKAAAIVDEGDDGQWAEILPDVSVKVGDKLYAAPPAAQYVSGLIKALERISDLFPLGLVRQEFRVNGGAPLQADGDTEFLSYQKVNRIAGEILSIADNALAAHRAQAQGGDV